MASVNKVILVGNLGRDPETRTFPSGDSVTNASIATTDKWKDKQTGEAKEHTEWHRLTFNGRLAEIAAQYLRKGSQIYVEGSIRTRKYNDKDGVEKFATDIRVDSMQMLGGNPNSSGQDGGRDSGQQRSAGGDQQTRGDARGSAQTQGRNSGNGGGYGQGGGNGQRSGGNGNSGGQTQQRGGGSGFDDMDDDIPF